MFTCTAYIFIILNNHQIQLEEYFTEPNETFINSSTQIQVRLNELLLECLIFLP